VHISKITRETHCIEWRNSVVIQVWNATHSAAAIGDGNISINLRFAHHSVL